MSEREDDAEPPSQRDRAPAKRVDPVAANSSTARAPSSPRIPDQQFHKNEVGAAEGAAPDAAATTRQGIKTSRSPAGNVGASRRRRAPQLLSITRRRSGSTP